MRYNGPQPCNGDTPFEVFQATVAPFRAIVELTMSMELSKGDAVWARLGMLQRVLEAGLSVTATTIKYALRDCLRLADMKYPMEWSKRRHHVLWESLKSVTEALEELTGPDDADCDLLTALGRETLLTSAESRRLHLLWLGNK